MSYQDFETWLLFRAEIKEQMNGSNLGSSQDFMHLPSRDKNLRTGLWWDGSKSHRRTSITHDNIFIWNRDCSKFEPFIFPLFSIRNMKLNSSQNDSNFEPSHFFRAKKVSNFGKKTRDIYFEKIKANEWFEYWAISISNEYARYSHVMSLAWEIEMAQIQNGSKSQSRFYCWDGSLFLD